MLFKMAAWTESEIDDVLILFEFNFQFVSN